MSVCGGTLTLSAADAFRYLEINSGPHTKELPVVGSTGGFANFIIGSKEKTTFTIPNSSGLKVRDIIVYGHLSILSENMEDTVQKGKLICRNLLLVGKGVERVLINVEVDATCINIYDSEEAFEEELRSIMRSSDDTSIQASDDTSMQASGKKRIPCCALM